MNHTFSKIYENFINPSNTKKFKASSVSSVTVQSPNELVTIPGSFRLVHYLQSYAYIGKCPSVAMGATKNVNILSCPNILVKR